MMRIEARDLGRTSGGHRILRGISLDFGSAGVFTIIGPNGAGKTTLLRALALLDKPSAGEVLYDGRAASRLSARDRTALRRVVVGHLRKEQRTTIASHPTSTE